ncbi:MAG TPA: lysophospholipid acyltransferase family protein [bacterium]|jgi:KDO2-lipid IV(A) lauroyltransferase|nr:lysophospholipid acyltransferase family protein [bacterium]HNT64358.1 lysophospholipid acyltransferase family protein [bacterium]HOX85348.1 lysophospholipid acyltransferase family protein [bacterium]HPG44507.1 lysophospholipid acyltransferase family protein [bacterium]HPM97065.1 lysophospholipid acyltransferase family protein [bacterium]
MRWYKKIQSDIEYDVLRVLIAFLRLIPRRALLAFARVFGHIVYTVVPIRKKVALDNLHRVFPQKSKKEIRRIARAAYIQFAQTAFEFSHLANMKATDFAQWVHFDNPELLDKLSAFGKGVICVSGHFGNWEYLGAAIRARGFPMVAVAKEQRNNRVDRLISDFRVQVGVETIQLGMALRGVVRSLRQNKFVALISDQDAHEEGLFVDFLGQPSSTAAGPAIFALKTGAPLLFGVAVRGQHGHHTVHLQQIPTDDLDGYSDHALQVLTQRHASALAEYIQNYPDHWLWMHKRWKTAPPSNEDSQTK